MEVLLSVPGSALVNKRWCSSVVAVERARELVSDEGIVDQLDNLFATLKASKIDSRFVVRPEIFSGKQAQAYLADHVQKMCGHIYIGPPHQLKYLKGIPNVGYFTPVVSTAQAGQIRREFEFNPHRLQSMHSCLNGFFHSNLLSDRDLVRDLILLPAKSLLPGAERHKAKTREFLDPLVAPLFLNNYDAGNSAHVMGSQPRPFTQHLAARPGLIDRTPVFLAVLSPNADLPTGIAPALRDFAYLALAGVKFTVVVMLEGVSTLSAKVLENLAQRLNASLKIAGFHAGLIGSDAIVITPVINSLAGVLRLCSHILLFDSDWPDSEIAQTALISGVKPILLSNAHAELKRMFAETALVISEERKPIRRPSGEYCPPFDYPSAGSLQNILSKSVVERLSPQQRAANSQHAAGVFRQASSRLRMVFEPKKIHEIRFG